MKVSVVVPVYNAGGYLDDCIASLVNQSMPPSDYEVILVDDGSTDGSGARVDEAAREHPNVRAIHIPNSGWPGRPRNVGLDAASGEFVYFVDNDDRLEPRALARLYRRAVSQDADIVIGKVVGHGKGLPRDLFRANVDGATLATHLGLLSLLTPHKLFRRSLLEEHGIRFPEGRRRLEDHMFVVPAYFAARRVSVLADYPCYHWVVRTDQSNASRERSDPARYYDNVGEVLDIVDAHVPAGQLRDRLYAHWYRGKTLGRVGGRGFPDLPPDYRRALVTAARDLARQRFGPHLYAELTPNLRLRARLLDAGDEVGLVQLAELERGMTADVELVKVRARKAATVGIELRSRLRYADGAPVTYERDGDRLRWLPAGPLRAVAERYRDDLDVTDAVQDGRLDLVLRHRPSAIEQLVACTTSTGRRRTGRVVEVILTGATEVAASTAAAGAPLRRGTWGVRARHLLTGFERLAPLPAGTISADTRWPASSDPDGQLHVVPYWSTEENLRLEVARDPAKLKQAAAPASGVSRLLELVRG